jgi:hypothetical protein
VTGKRIFISASETVDNPPREPRVRVQGALAAQQTQVEEGADRPAPGQQVVHASPRARPQSVSASLTEVPATSRLEDVRALPRRFSAKGWKWFVRQV